MSAVIIPVEQLSEEILLALVEEFVNRDGTDYGEFEVSLEEKTRQVIAGIRAGQLFVVYDDQSESTTVISRDDLQAVDRLKPD